jgi:signal transduction histidine kinase
VRTRDCEGGVEIEIADTGRGIPPEIRPRLFQPFFTTKPAGEGTGLGLYISRCIAAEHGGSLDFRCPESGGTCFRVFLPGPRA